MKKMDKGLTVPKWVLINQPKIPQIPQKISLLQVHCSPKFPHEEAKCNQKIPGTVKNCELNKEIPFNDNQMWSSNFHMNLGLNFFF